MRPRKHSGFTLIELLVCMAIAAMILLACVSVLGNAGESYEQVGGRLRMDREAREVMRQLMEDLASAIDVPVGLHQESADVWPADRIGFYTLQPESLQAAEGYVGDLCAVRYQVRDIELGGRMTRCLMRTVHDSAETFKALREGQEPSLWLEGGSGEEPLAFGVLAFQVRRMRRGTAGAWQAWKEGDPKRPEALDLCLVIANRRLCGRLSKAGDWVDSRILGEYAAVDRHPDMKVYRSILTIGGNRDD